MRAAQRQDRVGAPHGPEHSRLFETRADHRLAASFDYTRAHKQVLAAKCGIPHPLCIPLEVVCLGANLLGHGGIAGVDGPQRAHQFFDFPLVQQTLLVDLHPSFLLDFPLGIELARHCPQMLASMVEVDNLNGPGKVFGDQIPYPFAHTGWESASRRGRVDPTAGLSGSLLARAGRYRLRWPRRYAPRIWWSPPNRPGAASARDHDRTEPVGPPERACGAPREKTPYFRCPVRHPPETGRGDIGSTSSRGEPCAPDRRSSGWVWSGFPGIGRGGHIGTATDADPPLGFRIATTRSRRRRPLGGEPFARPTLPLPDRSGRPCGVGQRHGRAVGLPPAPPPDGSQQPFFFLFGPAPPLLLDRAQSTDLVVESD